MWSFFGDIRCINLNTRNDRYEESSSVFKQYAIPVNYFRTNKHPNGGIQGCFESHLAIIRDAYDRKLDTVVIFEDDVIASGYLEIPHRHPELRSDDPNLKRAIDFMKQNTDWDLFYLGTHPDIRRYRMTHMGHDIYHLHSICTHAYVVSRRMMKKMYNLKFTGVAIDYYYLKTDHAYGIYPSLFYQRGSTSDIGGDFSSNIPIKHWWYRAVEIYAKYINIPLNTLKYWLLFLLVIIIVVAWWWFYYRRPRYRANRSARKVD